MGVITKPWFAIAVVLAAIGVWAFTIGPWGSWHERTTSTRLVLRGDTYRRQTLVSPAFSLNGGPATLRIKAVPPAGKSLMASVRWELIPTTPAADAAEQGSAGLTSPNLETGPYELGNGSGRHPGGGFRLRLSAAADSAAAITAAITEQRDFWHGIPVYGIILLAGVAYIGLTVVPRLRLWQHEPWIVGGHRHED
jgi:hypothetical protein